MGTLNQTLFFNIIESRYFPQSEILAHLSSWNMINRNILNTTTSLNEDLYSLYIFLLFDYRDKNASANFHRLQTKENTILSPLGNEKHLTAE